MLHWIDELPKREWVVAEGLDFYRILPTDDDIWTLRAAFKCDEAASVKYNDRLDGIERRWDALMKRRNEPKRKAWQVEVIGDMPNN